MNKLEIGKQLGRWIRQVIPNRVSEDQQAKADFDSEGKSELYSNLLFRTEYTGVGDERALSFCQEQVEGCGEDSLLVARDDRCAFLGVFDGCGGSGAKVYPSFGGHSGAWAASRAAALAARDWFVQQESEEVFTARIERVLQACKDQEPEGQLLMGSLSREFPTTVAAFTKVLDDDSATFFWCGDSRGYILDEDGLHQITSDDSAIQDAMRNLREDAPMTNVASASRPFVLHRANVKLEKPAFVFVATDGCFGYLPSPMAFERLLLETMRRAATVQAWKSRLCTQIKTVSGDDYTLAGWMHGFGSFKDMKQILSKRRSQLNECYPPLDMDEEKTFEQWERYRIGYERYFSELNPESGSV